MHVETVKQANLLLLQPVSDSGAFLGKYSNVTRQHHMLSTISVSMTCVKVTWTG